MARGRAVTCLSGYLQKTKFTFLRCAILLKWEFRKQLFSKLAWGQGPGAENDIFMCMVRGHALPEEGQGCQGGGDRPCAVRVLPPPEPMRGTQMRMG